MNPRETNLKIINEAVAEVSDTMELKFGCQVKIERRDSPLYSYIIEAWHGPDKWWYKIRGSPVKYIAEDFAEILGREAQLAEILLAINSTKFTIMLDNKGNMYDLYYSINKAKWDLSGGIEHQEDSVLQFIAELLK